jgi:hypothetical protein
VGGDAGFGGLYMSVFGITFAGSTLTASGSYHLSTSLSVAGLTRTQRLYNLSVIGTSVLDASLSVDQSTAIEGVICLQ